MNELETTAVATEEILRLELPATHKYLNVLGACISEVLSRVSQLEAAENLSNDIQLAAHEICTNIVQHAYGPLRTGRIKIQLQVSQQPRRQLVIEFEDTGSTFDPALVAAPDLENGQVHGYGLFLVHSLMDEVIYQPKVGGNYWCLIKYL